MQQLVDQKEQFISKSGFDEKQYSLIVKAFNLLGSYCARNSSNSPLSVAWEKIKEAGIIPSNDAMNAYLYVTGTTMATSGFILSSSLSSSKQRENNDLSTVMNILGGSHETKSVSGDGKREATHSTISNQQRVDLPTELAIFHDLLFEPTEKSVSLRVRKLVAQGNAQDAELLLNSFPVNDDVRLRTYLPILKLYCEQGNASSALKLFQQMRNEPSVRLEPETYILLLSSLMERGCFRPNAEEIKSACELGYKNECGPDLFDELMTEMADDVLEISSASARRLYNAIAEGCQGYKNILHPIRSLAGLVTDNTQAKPDELLASRVTVGETTGICPRSGVKLKLIKLEKHQRKELHGGLIKLSNTRFEEFSQNDSTRTVDYAEKHLNSFANWLNERKGQPFTAIVDGANIAYYMQNFDGGLFNIHQIEFMVEALEKMNENPLVVLPYKYCSPSFHVQMGGTSRRQVVKKDEKEILDKLVKRGQLYRVPARCLDDYYWMLASVSDQIVSLNGADLDVPVENEEGRWPGARPMLISNDQMRDHKLGLLEPRLFRRWFSCYIVNYSFTAFVGNESVDREIGFSTADFFSREIQANGTDFGTVWHIPVSDWKLDDRFCIRISKGLTTPAK